jgi:hypothetical protein
MIQMYLKNLTYHYYPRFLKNRLFHYSHLNPMYLSYRLIQMFLRSHSFH